MEDNNVEEKTIQEPFQDKNIGEDKGISAQGGPASGWKKYIPFVLELAKIAIIAFVIVAPIRYFLFQPFIVSGASMAPNFATGDYLIVDEISYRFSTPQRGDVIVFDASFIKGYEGQRFIKRIIGIPGDEVDITKGKVEIIKDNKTTILAEKYLPSDLKTYGDVNITLKSDQYFVLGDNRDYSYDSRMWGFVPKNDIIGKAVLRIFPITNFSEISRPAYN
jgi:signal peptidase I